MSGKALPLGGASSAGFAAHRRVGRAIYRTERGHTHATHSSAVVASPLFLQAELVGMARTVRSHYVYPPLVIAGTLVGYDEDR